MGRKKDKWFKKTINYYRYIFKFEAPFKIIVDGNSIAVAHKKKFDMKEALSNGLISLADSYGMPLEIGCTVAFYANGRVKVGKVTGQTTVKVTCKEQNSKWSNNCYPFEVARIL